MIRGREVYKERACANLHDSIDHLSSDSSNMFDPSYDPSLLVISQFWNHDTP